MNASEAHRISTSVQARGSSDFALIKEKIKAAANRGENEISIPQNSTVHITPDIADELRKDGYSVSYWDSRCLIKW